MRQPLSVINENNPVWSGYDDVAQDNTPSYPGLYWTDAHAQWSVPTVGSSPAGRVLTWVGLGGDVATYDCDVQSAFGNTNDLCVIQAGTASTTGNPAQYYFWWEDFPYNQIQAVSSLSVSAGNQAYADASYLGNSQSSFFIENLSTNKYTSFTVSTPDVSLTSTDFILEEGYGGTGFTHFNTVTFASCTAQGRYNSGSVGGAVEAFNFRKITLVNNGTTYATPSWINSPTDGFSVSSNI